MPRRRTAKASCIPGKFRRKALEPTITPFLNQQSTTPIQSNHSGHIHNRQNATLTIRGHPFHLQRTTLCGTYNNHRLTDRLWPGSSERNPTAKDLSPTNSGCQCEARKGDGWRHGSARWQSMGRPCTQIHGLQLDRPHSGGGCCGNSRYHRYADAQPEETK